MFVIATHLHEYGADSALFITDSTGWLGRRGRRGAERHVAEALDFDYEPERDESIVFTERTTGQIPKISPPGGGR